jgi:hypothetical protein
MIDAITDFFDQAKALSVGDHAGKPNWEGLLQTFSEQNQLVDDVIIDLLNRTVDLATGDALEVLGRLVGQPNDGATDALYRSRIRARIAANSSKGTWEDLINVVNLVTNDPTVTMTLTQFNYMTITVYLQGTLTTDDVNVIVIDMLNDARAAGERVLLHHLTDTPANTFTLGSITDTTGSLLVAATTVPVDSTAGFADSGQITIEKISGSEDLATYTSKDATNFLGVTGITSTHISGVRVQTPNSSAKGFADDSAPGTGGHLASILE